MARPAKRATKPLKPKPEKVRDPYNIEVGRRLQMTREALKALGVGPKTQTAFAKSVEIPKTNYNNCETGYAALVPENAVKILRRYKISLDWLYADDIESLEHDLYVVIKRARENDK